MSRNSATPGPTPVSTYTLVPFGDVQLTLEELFGHLSFKGPQLDALCEMSKEGWGQGVPTHGANVLYLTHGALGLVTPNAEPTCIKETKRLGVEEWDGNGCAGPYAAFKAADRAMEMANTVVSYEGEQMRVGTAHLFVKNCGHVGNPGAFVHYLTSRGFSARLYTWGGRTECMQEGQKYPRSSTATVTWGHPTKSIGALPHDVITDFCLAYAMGKVRALIEQDGELPDYVPFFDMDGAPVHDYDPSKVFPNGAVGYENPKSLALATAGIELGASLWGFQVPSQVSLSKQAAWEGREEEPMPDLRPGGFELQIVAPPTPESFLNQHGVSLKDHVSAFVENLYSGEVRHRIPYARRAAFREACEKHGGLLLKNAQLKFLEDNTDFSRSAYPEIKIA